MEEKIDYTNDDLNDEYSNDDLLNIQSWGVDLSVQDLLFQYKEEDILKPELQRNYVWEQKEASRFIESLLLGLPVPSIFLANMPDERRLIVDGYQRIMTLHHYITLGKWKDTDDIFKLCNSTLINEKWRNKAYADLDSADQRRLRLYTIHAIVFEQKRPRGDSSLYQIFERINTSGKTLLPQEIRNCVYQGAMNTLLINLNHNEDWRFLYGSEKVDERMRDIELILRFLAMNTPEVYNSDKRYISLKLLLNDYMGSHVKASQDFLDECAADFCRTVSFVREHFHEESFYNLQKDNSKYRKRLYPTVFDSLMIGTSIALKNGYNYDGADLAARKLSLLSNQNFKDCITQGTMQVENIKKRISMILENIYNLSLS